MKNQLGPFNAKSVGEICIEMGEPGIGAVARLDQVCRIEGYDDCIKIFGAESALVPRIKEAIRQEWSEVAFVDAVNVLFVYGKVEREQTGRSPLPADFVGSRKVAIVGVEGSGKTVMLAGLGALCSQPDGNGCFLSPKNFETVSYVNRQMSALKDGKWPYVANNFGWLETFAVCTVDKTVLDDDGRPVPAPDFSTKGLAPIMEWVLKSWVTCKGGGSAKTP